MIEGARASTLHRCYWVHSSDGYNPCPERGLFHFISKVCLRELLQDHCGGRFLASEVDPSQENWRETSAIVSFREDYVGSVKADLVQIKRTSGLRWGQRRDGQ